MPPFRILPAVLACLAAAACADSAADPAPAATVTVTATQAPAAPAVQPSPAPPKRSAKPADPDGKKIKMPNVVGRNHQEAQDFLQSKGIFHLAEEDATGQDRVLVWDRNWTVVRQHPKPGVLVDPETVTVTLSSKKSGE